MKKLPLARSTDIIVQNLGSEVLIYDLKTHKAFNLNETSAIVYQTCDGETSFNQLREKHNFTDELIFLALDDLRKENLIEDDKSFASPFNGMSRREAIRKVGLGTMIALPVISSLLAPTAAQAQSGAAAVTCVPGSCACILSISSPDTTCSGGAVRFSVCGDGDGCVCQVSRVGCDDMLNGNEICFGGSCVPATA